MGVRRASKEKPQAVKLFGRWYTRFYDRVAHVWCACDDACPHRLAPLSEGRLVQSTSREGLFLECAYHGWRFSSITGKCIDIPNAKDAPIPRRACIQRFYAVARSSTGLLFLWPGDRTLACESKLPVHHSLQGIAPERLISVLQFHRRFPFSYDVLVENLVDPSHVNWAHHGESASDRCSVVRLDSLSMLSAGGPDNEMVRDVYRALQRVTPRSGIEGRRGVRDAGEDTIVNFTAPGYINATVAKTIDGQPERHFMSLASPTDVNECTLYLNLVFVDIPPIQMLLISAIPKWISHTRINIFLDGDTPLLQYQKANISQRRADSLDTRSALTNADGTKPSSTMRGALHREFVPSPGGWDCLVLAFRKWFEANEVDMHFPGGLPGQYEALTVTQRLDRIDVNDHRAWHIDSCRACKTALRNARIAVFVFGCLALTLSVASITLHVVSMATKAATSTQAVLSLVTAFVCVGLTFGLVRLVMLMTYTNRAQIRFHQGKTIVD